MCRLLIRATGLVAVVVPLFTPILSRADVTATVNGKANVKPISTLIYGSNQSSIPSTSDRLGGNRWTAYNWETNASNAGSDYRFQNDGYLATSNTPGAAVLPTLKSNASAGKATLLTIPMAGYVAADKNGDGDIRTTANYLTARLKTGAPAKGSAFSLTPDVTDGVVYQDEFVNWVNHNTTGTQQVLYDLDNEPDLWSSTHAEVHPKAVTYAELAQKNVAYAAAIKAVAPKAMVLGAVNYGWTGFRKLQNAADANGRDFQAFYLQQMKAADTAAGKRLVDALDFHWYPEANGPNAAGVATRIDGSDASAGVAAARVQAPRSLWDPNYIETSYITKDTLPANGMTGKAIALLPRTQALINANDPGMKMAVTEYNYGGGDTISGGIAEADVLGVFGEQGVYAANWWDVGSGNRFTNAAMRMYLNYDGKGGHFGDTSVGSTVSDNGTASIHAAIDSTTGKLTLVIINKGDATQTLDLSLAALGSYTAGQAYQLTGSAAVVSGVVQIARLSDVTLGAAGTLRFTMPPLSVTTLVLVPEPTGLIGVATAGLVLRRRRRR